MDNAPSPVQIYCRLILNQKKATRVNRLLPAQFKACVRLVKSSQAITKVSGA